MVRKFDVPSVVFRSSRYLPCNVSRQRAVDAIRVSSEVRLTFNHGWFPDKEWNVAGLYPVERSSPSGAELLDILCGARSGMAEHFSL